MMGQKKAAKTVVEPIDEVSGALEEIELLAEMAADERDELVLDDAEKARLKEVAPRYGIELHPPGPASGDPSP